MASLRLKIIGFERNGFLIQHSKEGGRRGTLCLLFYMVFSFMDVKKLEQSLKSSPLLSLTIKTSPIAWLCCISYIAHHY